MGNEVSALSGRFWPSPASQVGQPPPYQLRFGLSTLFARELFDNSALRFRASASSFLVWSR